MVSRRTYRKPVPRGPSRYLRPGGREHVAADLLHIDGELADRLAGIEQIEDAMARGDMADLGRRIDEPALRRHVRDRDQLCAPTDRALERGVVELPRRVVLDHIDLDSRARLHLQERALHGNQKRLYPAHKS
jgi:hypothetical protein